jgi:hypothetical protein
MNNQLFVAPLILERNVIPFDEHVSVARVSKLSFFHHCFVNGSQDSDQIVEQENVGEENMNVQEVGILRHEVRSDAFPVIHSHHSVEESSETEDEIGELN